MTEPTKYFVVTKKAVPEVLLKVVEAKRLLESGKLPTIQDAVDAVGISRSSFYKYKDDIFPFHDSTQGKTVTLSMQIEDEPGLLSGCSSGHCTIWCKYSDDSSEYSDQMALATLSISVQVLQTTKDISEMLDAMEKRTGVHSVKILAKE